MYGQTPQKLASPTISRILPKNRVRIPPHPPGILSCRQAVVSRKFCVTSAIPAASRLLAEFHVRLWKKGRATCPSSMRRRTSFVASRRVHSEPSVRRRSRRQAGSRAGANRARCGKTPSTRRFRARRPNTSGTLCKLRAPSPPRPDPVVPTRIDAKTATSYLPDVLSGFYTSRDEADRTEARGAPRPRHPLISRQSAKNRRPRCHWERGQRRRIGIVHAFDRVEKFYVSSRELQ